MSTEKDGYVSKAAEGRNTRALNRFDAKVVSLRGLLEKQLRLADEAADALKREFLSVPTEGGARSLSPTDAKKIADLSRAAVLLVDADIRYQKALAARGGEQTPDEEDAALTQLFMEMPRARRVALIRTIATAHFAEADARPEKGRPMGTTPGTPTHRILHDAAPEGEPESDGQDE